MGATGTGCIKPDWVKAEGAMAEAVEDGYKHLTDADRDAIAVYLNSPPAIENHFGE